MDLPLKMLTEPLPLTPLEQVLKHLTTVYLRGSCTREEMEQLTAKLLQNAPADREFALSLLTDTMPGNLMDADFIPQQAQVHMMLHARYTPAMLHSHTFFEVLYVACGSCINVFEDGLMQLQAGELLFIPPGLRHAISVFDDETNLVNFLVRTDALASALQGMTNPDDAIARFFDMGSRPGASNVLYISSDENLSYLVGRINMEITRGDDRFRSRIIESYFRILMVHLIRDYGEHARLMQVQVPEQTVDIVLQYLRSEMGSVTLSDLAYRLGYSYEHLSRMIKSATGKSFSALRREIRLQRAANLLCGTSRPVEEIAQVCGYETRSQFYAQFKAAYGVTPTQYRLGK